MTQALNLANFANFLNSSGQLSLSTGVTGTLTPSNGGTGLGSLTAGYIPFGNGTSAFGNSANLFWDSVNNRLGVNTNAPAGSLDVRWNQNGTSNFYLQNTDTTNVASRAFLNIVAGNQNLVLGSINADNAYINRTINGLYFQYNGAVQAYLDSSNNFFIGGGNFAASNSPVWSSTAARAWVNFTPSTGTVNRSVNVSSVTRNAAGDYTINFTNALINSNYVMAQAEGYLNTGNGPRTLSFYSSGTTTTTSCRIVNNNDSGIAEDLGVAGVVFFC